MKSKRNCKILTVGIIVLFIGVSIPSAISIDTKSILSKNKSVENCSYNNISNKDVFKLDKQLKSFEGYFELKKDSSTHNQELKSIYEDFLKLKSNISELESESLICILLFYYGTFLATRLNILTYFADGDILPGIIIILIHTRFSILFLRFLICLALGVSLECEWADLFTP